MRAPSAAPMVRATGQGTPRRACRASPPGCKRHAGTCSWSAGSSRWRRAVCTVTARTYACKTMGCAGVGPTTAESQRRWAGPQWARPVERLAWQSKNALRRNVASFRSLRVSARARLRSRRASSSPVGTETAVRSPARAWPVARRLAGAFCRGPQPFGEEERALRPSSRGLCSGDTARAKSHKGRPQRHR